MSIAKKSVKWLAAAVVVFALVLTAVFAAGTVASASADPVVNNFVDVDAIVVATDAAQNSTYPSYLPGSVHTITAYYYFAMPDATGTLPNFAFAPGISYGDDVILPDSITLNTAFGESISVDDEILEAYLNEDATVFSVDAQIPDGQTIAYFAGVNNDVTVSGKYLFSAVYTIPADAATGVYTYVLGTGSALGVNSGNTVYIPKLNASSFFIRQAVQLPTAAALTYNGSAQIAITADDEAPYTVSGSSQINAGTYENEDALILALKDTNITIWDLGNGVYSIEPQSIDWSIAKKEVNVTFVDPQTYTAVYGAAISVVPSLTNDGILAADLSGFNFGYTGMPEQGDNVGSYPLTITYVANDNYTINAETGVNYVITKKPITVPVSAGETYIYNGNPHTFQFTAASLVDQSYYTIKNNVRTNAGTYSGDNAVKAELNDKFNTEWADGTTEDLSFTFVINKKPITIPESAGETYTYNGNPHTFQFTTASLVDQSYYAISNNVRTAAGTYSGDNAVKAVLNDTDNTMWVGGSIEDQTYDFVIGKATPVIAITTPAADGDLRAYNGSAVTIGTTGTEFIYEVTAADANVVLTPVWEISDGNDWTVIDYVPTAAGSYRVHISASETDNYAAGNSNTRAFAITKANQTVSIVTADKIYDGAAFGASQCVITTNGSETPVLVTSSSTVEAQTAFVPGADVGIYNFKVYIPEDANYNAYLSGEETVEIVALTVTVTPVNVASVDYTGLNITSFTGDVTVYAVGGNSAALTAYLENKGIASLESALTYTLGANATVKNAGTYDNVVVPTVTAVANDSLANFNFDYATANVTVNKVANVISVFLSDGTTALTDGAIVKAYDAVAVTAGDSNADIIYATLENDGTVTYTFYNDNAGVRGSACGSDPILAGTYWIGLSATEGTNHLAVSEIFKQFVIEQSTVTVTLTYSLGNGEPTIIVTDAFDALSDIPAAPTFRYFDTDGFKFGGNVVTTFTLEMDGETLNAEYFFNVGKGDADGDGYVTARDIIKMKRAYAGLETLNIIDDAENMADVWALRESTGAYNTLFESALDVNSLDGLWPNDIVAVREALATGYDYKIIQLKATTGVTGQAVVYVNRVQVYTYDELVAAVKAGYPVDVMNDIDAATRTFDLDITLPADIDLKDNRLTVMGFALNTNTSGATLKIAGGTLYTVNGIRVTAPNGNVIVSNVNGYSYDGTSVVLAAYSSSLHIEENVAFYIYHVKNDLNERVAVADFAATVTADNAIVELADTRMEETSQKMQEIAAIKADTTKTETEKAEAINNKEVKKAIVEVPIDTHVVVEESANLTVDKLVVKEQSNTQAEEVTTFSIEVKSTTAETVSVDITEVKSEDNNVKVYYVEEVKVAAEADKVEIIQAQEQEVSVKNYVAKIGTQGYETLAAAIAAANADDTIVLLDNVSSVNGFAINNSMSIDLNGKTVTVETGANVNNRAFKITNGTLTIYNGEINALGGGTTSSNGYGCYGAFRAEVGTNLIATDLTLRNSRPWGLNVKLLGATAELTNVNIISSYGGGIEVTDDEGADGTVQGYAKMVNCSVTQSGYFDHCSSAVSVSGASTLDVYSTNYTAEYGVYVFSSGGTINIYGGTFTALSKNVLQTSYDANYGNAAIINVYDGTFYGTFGIVANGTTMNVYGGTFDHDPTAYVADGYIATFASDVYTVVPASAVVAKIGSIGYATLDDAITAANAGDTIDLLADISATETIMIQKSLTINGNDKTITATGSGSGYAIYMMYEQQDGINVAIKDLTIVSTGRQVAFMTNCDYACTATLTNVDITCDGECVYSNGLSTVYVNGCDFTHEGIYAEGKDAVYYSALIVGYNGAIVAEDCTVTSFGNGAATFPSGGIVTLTNTDITINEAASANANAGYAFWARNEDYNNLPGYNGDSIINFYSGNVTGAFKITDKYTGDDARNVFAPIINIYGGTFDHDPTAYVADGYACIEEDGMYTIVEAVASVNGVDYATLDSAINAAESGDTVMVLANIALTDFITINSTLTVDLNGHTISTDLGSAYNSKGVFVLDAGANLTIEDSSAAGTGAITGTGDRAAYGISMKSDAAATLTINGGYIFGKSAGIYTNTNSGSVIINDGYIKSTGSQAFNLGWGETYLTVNGGTIESENTYAIWTGSGAPSTDPSTVTINAGKIITPKTEGAICVGAGNVVINGGDFTETNRIFHNRATSAGHNFTFVISGGTFASMTYTNRVNYDDSQVAVDAYIADGYAATEADGIYTVSIAEGYTTVQNGNSLRVVPLVKTKAEFTAAITANWDYIVIGANINLSMYTYNRDMDLTIDLNGYTLTTTMTGITFSSAHTLNIVDTSASGNGAINSTGTYAINMGTASTDATVINVYGGTITGKTAAAVKVNDGTLNVYGGTLTCSAAKKYAILNYQGYAGTVNVYGGTLTADVGILNNGEGTVNVYGGTINATTTGLENNCTMADKNDTTCNTNVYGGTINAAYGIATFNKIADTATVTVEGGTFNVTSGLFTFGEDDTHTTTITVTAGTFNEDPTAYLADGYAVTEADGIYTVVAE